MYAALLITGYESHDDYIPTGELLVTVPAPSLEAAREAIHELAHSLVIDEWSGYWQILELKEVQI